MKTKDKKTSKTMFSVLSLLMGGALGVATSLCTSGYYRIFGVFGYVVLLAVFFAMLFLQTIVHELGHLIFGLISGYKFSSFRVGNVVLVKQNDKFRIKRLSIKGTAGQCLMEAPENENGDIPVMLYNFGGSIMNIISTIIGVLICGLSSLGYLLNDILIIFSLVGIFQALMNGIPLRAGGVDNDGYHALMLSKNEEARRAFAFQLKVNSLTMQGIRLKDMDESWFELPSFESMKNNTMIASNGVLVCNRLMDMHRFSEAKALMNKMINERTNMVGIYSYLLVCDIIYCEAIGDGENKKEAIDGRMTKQQEKFMDSMKNFLTVIRMRFVYALLIKCDEKEAEKWEKRFEKLAKTHPHIADVESERELMNIAKAKYKNKYRV